MRTKYIFHCDSCMQMIREDSPQKKCPPEKKGTISGAPMINFSGVRGTEYGSKKDGSVPYFDEHLDTMIYSKSHKEETLKERGLMQIDTGARKHNYKQRTKEYLESPEGQHYYGKKETKIET